MALSVLQNIFSFSFFIITSRTVNGSALPVGLAELCSFCSTGNTLTLSCLLLILAGWGWAFFFFSHSLLSLMLQRNKEEQRLSHYTFTSKLFFRNVLVFLQCGLLCAGEETRPNNFYSADHWQCTVWMRTLKYQQLGVKKVSGKVLKEKVVYWRRVWGCWGDGVGTAEVPGAVTDLRVSRAVLGAAAGRTCAGHVLRLSCRRGQCTPFLTSILVAMALRCPGGEWGIQALVSHSPLAALGRWRAESRVLPGCSLFCLKNTSTQ